MLRSPRRASACSTNSSPSIACECLSYEAIPDDKIEETLALYRTSLTTPAPVWLKQKMTQYEVSYVVWDKKADPDWQLQKYPFLKEAAMFGDIAIYRLVS